MTSNLFCSIASLLVLVSSTACGSCGPNPSTRGSTSLAWSILNSSGEATTCERVGAATVSLILHNRVSGDDATASFACTATRGTTSLLALGAYDATVSLRAQDGTPLATVPGRLMITIVAGQVAVLPPVTFTVDALGRLVLSIATPPTVSNCKSSGAGLSGGSIILEHAEGGCAPVTFIRARGATQTGTYTVNCSSPLNAGCIEIDETLTVPAIEAGRYIVRARGKIGPLDCWTLDDVIEVPPAGALTRTLNLVHRSAPGC